MQFVALQCSMEMQAWFMAEISIFDPQMLIWVDETGSARRNSVRAYGYSLKGMRAVPISYVLVVNVSMLLEL